MKQLICLTGLTLLIATSSFAQEPPSTSPSKWTITLEYSSDYYFGKGLLPFSEETGYELSQRGYDLTTGLKTWYQATNRLKLGTGLNFSMKDYSAYYYCNVCDFLIAIAPEKLKLRYLELPVAMEYKVIDKTWDFEIMAGVQNSYLVSQPVLASEPDFEHNPYLISANAGLGLSRRVGERTAFHIQSIYRHSLTKLNTHNNYRLKGIGLMMGLEWQL